MGEGRAIVAALGSRFGARLVMTAVALVGVAAATGCGVRPTNVGVTQLTVVTDSGPVQQAMIDAWQVPYRGVRPSVRFVNSSPPDPAQVKAQVEAGAVGWSIVSVPPWRAGQDCGTLYERLTVPDLDRDQFRPDTHGECFVVAYRYSVVFSYNAAKWSDPQSAPTTVQDFFDVERFPGTRGVAATLTDGLLEWALLADGVEPGGLYPLDVDRALAKWESIRSSTLWAPNADALLAAVRAEEVDLQLLLQPHTLVAIDKGAPIVPVWDVTLTGVSALAIPRGAPYADLAQQYLSFALRPEQQARLAELAGVEPVNVEAEPNRSMNSAMVNAFGPANTGTTVAIDQAWWSQHWAAAAAAFAAWHTPPPATEEAPPTTESAAAGG
jgi:putative spermidine/putrescine transport system substrate-binding protein